jgi:hypothetical protein
MFTNFSTSGTMKIWFPGGDGWTTPDGSQGLAIGDTLIMPATPMFIVPRSKYISIKNTGTVNNYIYLNAEY